VLEFLGANFGSYVGIIFALLLLEAVLSFDNAAVLAAMVRKLPVEQRKKALTYGLVGAYTLRFTAVAFAAILIKHDWIRVAGGAYLLFVSLKHFYSVWKHREGGHEAEFKGNFLIRLGVPMLWAVIIQVELMDLAFAVDQVVVAVGFTENIYLIFISSAIGILFLRIAAVYMTRVMDWLPIIEHMAFIAISFVGIKLILDVATHLHIPEAVSLTMTFGLFGLPVLAKLILKWPASLSTSEDPEAE
jgi:YkoY family integral membrane protein